MRKKLSFIYILLSIWILVAWGASKVSPVEEVTDSKHFKQLLRTRTNVLVLFTKNKNAASPVSRAYRDAAEEVRGIGTLLNVDCSGSGQKLCRQLKAAPDPFVIQHFKDGKFHKVYDRLETTKSIVRFMNDPTGDRPWEEEPSGKDVVHLDGPKSLAKLLKKHKRALIMFYAPWCVYCKHMKPEFAAAAATVKENGIGVLAAMDVVRPENSGMRTKYNITGFPTVHYFKNGEILATYEGENKKDKIVEFMKDPSAVPVKAKETPWSEEKSDVHHLTTENFDQFIKDKPSTVVMFYAPWCGHCKSLKPEWVKAAAAARSQQLASVLAAVDTTKETKLAERFKVKGFPTIKYFKDGEFAFDTPNIRDMKKIVEFLRDPKEPPPAPPPEPNWADVPSEVVHLTEENFKSQLRSKRHALVMFYAPWCGHCKAAKPEFEVAAERLKDEPRMVLAAVNCVDHQALCKHYEVKGYPTFKYFKYQKEAISYDGGRKAADFTHYLTNLEPDYVAKSETVEVTTSPPQPSSAPGKKSQLASESKDQENEDSSSFPGWDKLIHLSDENYKTLLSEHKHLLIMFHAKWCGHCKDLKPVFAEVAQDLDSSVATLAACDADRSTKLVDDFMIVSLPAFKYVRDGKPVTDYDGERTTAGLRDFVNKIKTLNKDEL